MLAQGFAGLRLRFTLGRRPNVSTSPAKHRARVVCKVFQRAATARERLTHSAPLRSRLVENSHVTAAICLVQRANAPPTGFSTGFGIQPEDGDCWESSRAFHIEP